MTNISYHYNELTLDMLISAHVRRSGARMGFGWKHIKLPHYWTAPPRALFLWLCVCTFAPLSRSVCLSICLSLLVSMSLSQGLSVRLSTPSLSVSSLSFSLSLSLSHVFNHHVFSGTDLMRLGVEPYFIFYWRFLTRNLNSTDETSFCFDSFHFVEIKLQQILYTTARKHC